jgi:hypothetical protein
MGLCQTRCQIARHARLSRKDIARRRNIAIFHVGIRLEFLKKSHCVAIIPGTYRHDCRQRTIFQKLIRPRDIQLTSLRLKHDNCLPGAEKVTQE